MVRHLTGNRLSRLAGAASAALLVLGLISDARAEPPARAARRSAANANRGPAGVYERSRFREPSQDEFLQFYAELRANGWPVVGYAAIPTRYEIANGRVQVLNTRRATFFGDIDGDRQPEWVVGCYFPPPARGAAPESPVEAMMNMQPAGDERARLVVFKREPGGPWRFHWRSPGLGYEFRPPRFNIQEVDEGLDRIGNLRLPISLVDVDNDGKLDIAYHAWSEVPTVGALPGVFRHDGSRFASVAPQADRFSLRDLDGDRKLEVITGSPYVGYGMGDDDVPRIWKWNGRRYQEASREYPAYYAGLVTVYQAYVRSRHQGDDFPKEAWQRAIQKAVSLAGQVLAPIFPAGRPSV